MVTVTLELSTVVLFAVALIVNAGSPGPSIAALVSRVLVTGWKDVLPFIAAMWVGEIIWLSAAVLGLSALAETMHWAFVLVKYCGVAYLLYLAWKMWAAPVRLEPAAPTHIGRRSQARMFLAGLAVTLGNPKIMVFYLALLPNIVDLATLGTAGWAALSITLLAVLAVIDAAYIVLASRARRLLRRPKTVRLANRLGALCMGGAAAAIATR